MIWLWWKKPYRALLQFGQSQLTPRMTACSKNIDFLYLSILYLRSLVYLKYLSHKQHEAYPEAVHNSSETKVISRIRPAYKGTFYQEVLWGLLNCRTRRACAQVLGRPFPNWRTKLKRKVKVSSLETNLPNYLLPTALLAGRSFRDHFLSIESYRMEHI